MALGLILSGFSSLGIPVIIIEYGEFTTLLLDRTKKNSTTPTVILPWFGGGKML